MLAATGRPDPFTWPDHGRTGGDLFAAMVLHISSQQISTVMAFRLYDGLARELGGIPDAAGVAALPPERWRELGFSHAKVAYLTALAQRCLDGELDLAGAWPAGRTSRCGPALTALPGVGRWTSEMFLIFQLHRPDIFPAGDRACAAAVGRWLPPAGTSVREVEARSAIWAPYRTYAAAALWHSLDLGRPGSPLVSESSR